MRIAVVGAGAFGASAARELARRRHRVTLIDPGPIPHPEAASTDISKIVRTDYGADPFYAGLADQAIAEWELLNEQATTPFYHPDGFLLLAGGVMAPGGFEHDSLRVALAAGRPAERLSPAAFAARFPAWSPDAFHDGYLSLRAGWAASGRATEWLVDRAVAEGAELVLDRVSRVHAPDEGEPNRLVSEPEDGSRGGAVGAIGSCVVETASGAGIEADVVVVAAGARTASLVPDLADRMWPTGQTVLHFRVDPDRFSAPAFPPWAFDIARTGMYGFPALPDGTFKVARHGRGVPLDPSGAWTLPAETVAREESRVRDFFARAIPAAADAPLISARLCAYCDTFDGDFWIDRHPTRPALVVAAGGSGHGFKFAPVLGGAIADVVEGGAALSRFRWRARGDRRTEHARAAD